MSAPPTPAEAPRPAVAPPKSWAWASPWLPWAALMLWPLSAWPTPWDLRLQPVEATLGTLVMVAVALGWLWSWGLVLLRPGCVWMLLPRTVGHGLVAFMCVVLFASKGSLAPPRIVTVAHRLNGDLVALGPKGAAMPPEVMAAQLNGLVAKLSAHRVAPQREVFPFPSEVVEHLVRFPRQRRWSWMDPQGAFWLGPPNRPTEVGAVSFAHFPHLQELWLAMVHRVGFLGEREWQVVGPWGSAWPSHALPSGAGPALPLEAGQDKGRSAPLP